MIFSSISFPGPTTGDVIPAVASSSSENTQTTYDVMPNAAQNNQQKPPSPGTSTPASSEDVPTSQQVTSTPQTPAVDSSQKTLSIWETPVSRKPKPQTVKLPEFDSVTVKCLKDGTNRAKAWSSVVHTVVNHYLNMDDKLRNQSTYKEVGESLTTTYPSLRREGFNPWVCI